MAAAVFDPAGRGLGRPQFKTFQAKTAKITCTPSLGMQFDGEVIPNNSGVFGARVLPKCLDIIVDEFSNLRADSQE
ncbi:diacylglycerol kinase catalytic region [Collinsella sp. CAG:398]|nr:diacylglycerol kinase catalytic region [Collinsella sp. CAG:398]